RRNEEKGLHDDYGNMKNAMKTAYKTNMHSAIKKYDSITRRRISQAAREVGGYFV
ncbi:MAG: hypothetical protein GOV02_03575, partial [Candidatus Aenigmarchaeota archaeon]|nr:hypothetical protein [Candidatus Aenigmarchaeota archaeon]